MTHHLNYFGAEQGLFQSLLKSALKKTLNVEKCVNVHCLLTVWAAVETFMHGAKEDLTLRQVEARTKKPDLTSVKVKFYEALKDIFGSYFIAYD